LHLVAVRSEYASAKILEVDTSIAESMPGVKAIITHKDVPGTNMVGALKIRTEPLFAVDEVGLKSGFKHTLYNKHRSYEGDAKKQNKCVLYL
jgi:xanthine dehydrogenase molybdopterin-binding subunit B